MAVILVVDDEPLQRDILKTILSEEGFETHTASSGDEALKMVRMYNPDVVLTDLKMRGMDGIEVLEKLRSGKYLPSVIIMTAFGTIDSAVHAMKKGAFDYLTKPLDRDVVILTVKRALDRIDLFQKNIELRKALNDVFSIQGIIGNSKAIKEVINVIKKVADSTATVLILGESGTGKELIAKAIHYNSSRKEKTFTAINCAAIPETLLESELFGYEPGAFTGASVRKKGLFESANGGTLLLDEIGDLPAMTQVKILRVLQEKEFMRIGGREPIKVDVRIISATNKDIETEMKNNRFREDLYYRLKVVTINMPPLRERKEDIPDLVYFFISKFNKEFNKNILQVDNATMNALVQYYWPGNVRQLHSAVEKAVLMCDSDTLFLHDIESELRNSEHHPLIDVEIPDEGISLDDLEKYILKQAMTKANHVVSKAAKLVGMTYKTFWYRWDKLTLEDLEKSPKDSPPIFNFEIPNSGLDFEELEKILMKKAMIKVNGVAARAARLLKISEKAFRLRWEKYGIELTSKS